MGGIHRIVLGKYKDAAEGAALTRTTTIRRHDTSSAMDTDRMIAAVVERVRRHFGRQGNKYARVAYAMFHHRKWQETGLPKRTFFHAKKKVEIFLEACKQRAKPMSEIRGKGNSLH